MATARDTGANAIAPSPARDDESAVSAITRIQRFLGFGSPNPNTQQLSDGIGDGVAAGAGSPNLFVFLLN